MTKDFWLFVLYAMPYWLIVILAADRFAYYRGYRSAAMYVISQSVKLLDKKCEAEALIRKLKENEHE